MKSFVFVIAVSAVMVAFAGSAPVITPSSVVISQELPKKPVVLTYHVDKPAVVTVAFYNNGVEMPANLFTNLTGDVNRKVAAGDHTITWNPMETWPNNSTTGNTFSAKITAWATNCPPDYMVIDLRDLNKRVPFAYYTSTNWLPGTLEDKRYRTTHMVMRKIPAANKTFWMGSPSGEWGRSPDWTPSGYAYDPQRENRHRAHLTNDFYMCIYPMTYRQHLYPNNFRIDYPLASYYSNPGDFDNEGECWELPMCGVSYASLREVGGDYKYWPRDGHDVQVSSAVSNGLIGRKLRLLWGVEFDLPTEAQWEFACRAGTSAAVYADGDEIKTTASTNSLDKVAWYLDRWTVGVNTSSNQPTNPDGKIYLPQRVGLKQPNAFGLYDMLGNVWEWCLDASSSTDYPTASPDPLTDPPGLDVETNNDTVYRSARGGSFLSPAYMCRASERIYTIQTYGNCAWAWPLAGTDNIRHKTFGYRLVCPAIAVR
jgi:formylglycine-generating enzyme required for sulfatase activity